MKRLLVLAISLLILLCIALTVAGQQTDENANARDALFAAIQAEDEEAVLRILSYPHHVDLNYREPGDGGTFLIAAIREKHPRIVRTLLERGADPNLRQLIEPDNEDPNLKGDSPMDAAIESDDIEVVRLLIQYGVNLQRYPSALHSTTSIGMARLLINCGAPVDSRDEDGVTYLQTVANDEEAEDVARLLIERGANVNVRDEDGMTLLHSAVMEPRIEFAKLLIAHGADVNAKDANGYTPLDILIEGSFDYDLALFLVSRGARINGRRVKEAGLEQEFEKIKRTAAGGRAGLSKHKAGGRKRARRQ
jgi:ankyrin repeat protein